MKRNKTKALIDLLDDEDRHVSTLAMEQLLQMDTELDHLVAEYQESHNPVLRGRIHQLGSILQLRRDRASFIENVKNQSISLWDGIVQINYHFNPQLRLQDVTETMEDIIGRLPANPSTVKLAAFMRNENFSYTGEDILGPDLFLIEDVLVQRVGSPVILAALAHQLGAVAGWQSSIVIT
jgi:hypothetical protein